MKYPSFKKLKASFKASFDGLRTAHSEQTFQLLCFCGFLAIVLMLILDLTVIERVIIVFLIVSVLGFELLNSQIEKILDFLEPNHDPRVKRIKDISAGAVLVVSLGAAIIGLLIFFPHFKDIIF